MANVEDPVTATAAVDAGLPHIVSVERHIMTDKRKAALSKAREARKAKAALRKLEKAKKLKAEITLGAAPRAESDARKAVPTFSEFMTGQYFSYSRGVKTTSDKDKEYFRLRLEKAFGQKRVI